MNKAIGVFDSGFGGLTVVSEILKQLPNESIIYFGDTAHLPYGSKSKETITKYSLAIKDFLLNRGVKIIVVACNTASACAIDALKKSTEVPVVDVINPGARAVLNLTKNKRIGIIGTTATIKSKAYEATILKLNSEVRIFTQQCPLIVPLVEEGWIENQVTLLIAKEYLTVLKEEKIDSLVLGCTHYPLLKKIIMRVMGLEVALVDSAEETAKEVKRVLSENKLMNENSTIPANFEYFVSDDPEKFVKLGKNFLGKEITNIEKIEL